MPDDSSMGFVHIPAGGFTMGSNPAVDRMAYGNERWSATRRQGRPELPSYYIARYETSVAQFAAYLNATGQSLSGVEGLAPDLPITGITCLRPWLIPAGLTLPCGIRIRRQQSLVLFWTVEVA